jgi:hypothetical protein
LKADKNLCIKALVHSIRTFSNPFFSASVFIEKLPLYLQHQSQGPLVIKDLGSAVLPGHHLMDIDDEEDLTGIECDYNTLTGDTKSSYRKRYNGL